MQLMKEIDSCKEENAMLQLQIEGLKADQRDADDAHARQEKVKNRFCSSNSYCCNTSVDHLFAVRRRNAVTWSAKSRASRRK